MLLLGGSISTLRGDKFFRSTVVLSFERSISTPGQSISLVTTVFFSASPPVSASLSASGGSVRGSEWRLLAPPAPTFFLHHVLQQPVPDLLRHVLHQPCDIVSFSCLEAALLQISCCLLWFFFPGNCTAWETTGAAAVVLFRFVSTAHALQF
jgi:hypothetical protein